MESFSEHSGSFDDEEDFPDFSNELNRNYSNNNVNADGKQVKVPNKQIF